MPSPHRGTSFARRFASVAATGLVVASFHLLAAIAPVSASGAPYTTISTTAQVGCDPAIPLAQCKQWNVQSSSGLDHWKFDESRTSEVGPSTAKGTGKLEFTETDGADGMLQRLVITGRLSIEIVASERADLRADISADFLTRSKSLTIAGTAHVEAHGTDSLGSGANLHVQLDCGSVDVAVEATGGFETQDAEDAKPLDEEAAVLSETGDIGECHLEITLIASGGSNKLGADPAQHTTAVAEVGLTIGGEALPTPTPGPTSPRCALAGAVTDGDVLRDLHNDPLADVLVELRRDDAVVGAAVATDASGRYCIPDGAAAPGTYKLRATLTDAGHEPPLLETRHTSDIGPTWAEIPIRDEDFGTSNVDLTFTGTTDRPWLPDVAAIHWQAARYINWIVDKLEVAPGLIGPTTIVAFAADETHYDEFAGRIEISRALSKYAERDGPWALGPKGVEWHEITHRLADSLGFGAANSCPLEDPDGGWPNASTCASLDEGFAVFLPALAEADLDPGNESRGYMLSTDLEDNGFFPWAHLIVGDHTVERESFAVAQLLWDLADDTPLERAPVYLLGSTPPFTASDGVSLGGIGLVHAILDVGAHTVYDLNRELTLKVPNEVVSTRVDVDGDGTEDVDLLDELLLIHGFHSVDNILVPVFSVGTTVGRTDHVPDTIGLLVRHMPELIPGAAIRFTNGATAPATYTVDIAYPGTASRFSVTVRPGTEELVRVELPPYWRGVLAAGDPLPACGGKDQRTVTLTIAGAGAATRVLDSCTYFHLIAAASGDAALTFGSAAGPASAAALTSLVLPLAALLAVVVLLVIGAIAVRRRRGGRA